MHRISISLSIMALIVSQQISCAFYSQQAISAYEEQGAREIFRNHEEMLKEHPEILKQIKAEQNQKNTPKENVVTTGRTTPLKGSTDKVNERR